jgi:signal transduction histidine kinase
MFRVKREDGWPIYSDIYERELERLMEDTRTKNNTEVPSSRESVVTDETQVYETLKPYIAHCLSLNHDINNPLAGVIGYAEYMLEDDTPLTKDQRHYVQQILKCAERIKEHVDSLSDEKIALSEKVDMSSVAELYKGSAKPLK